MSEQKFYVLNCEDVGPNAEPLNEEVMITDYPGRTNQSNEVKLEGWLGTTNDVYWKAHGEYDTLEAAIEYVKKHWPSFSEISTDENDETELKRFKDTREIWSVDDWLHEWAKAEIEATTTDTEIDKHAATINAEADEQNIYINGCVSEYLTVYRDNLKSKQSDGE